MNMEKGPSSFFTSEIEVTIQSVANGFLLRVMGPNGMKAVVIQSTGNFKEDLETLSDTICSLYLKEG